MSTTRTERPSPMTLCTQTRLRSAVGGARAPVASLPLPRSPAHPSRARRPDRGTVTSVVQGAMPTLAWACGLGRGHNQAWPRPRGHGTRVRGKSRAEGSICPLRNAERSGRSHDVMTLRRDDVMTKSRNDVTPSRRHDMTSSRQLSRHHATMEAPIDRPRKRPRSEGTPDGAVGAGRRHWTPLGTFADYCLLNR